MAIPSAVRTAGWLIIVNVMLAANALAADPIPWRTDYNEARKEAIEKNLPIFVEIGTEECFYCRKLENGPFKDPALAKMLGTNFIPLKIDANRDVQLARALKVSLYPTMVLAGHDGKIYAFLEGYMESERIQDNIKRMMTVLNPSDVYARDVTDATKAIAATEYSKAVALLKIVLKDAADKPVGLKAKELLDGVEKLAAAQLTRAKELEQNGSGVDAMDVLADLLQTYTGTQAAADASTLLASLTEKNDSRERIRARRARDLMAMAKEAFKSEKYFDCLQHCEQLTSAFADQLEAKEAAALVAEVQANVSRLSAAYEQANERTAATYFTLAESWTKQGYTKEAATCLEKVVQLAPESTFAADARARLAKLERGAAMPTGFKKSNP
jgi:tetratricopeptide (TPR) repeat protein